MYTKRNKKARIMSLYLGGYNKNFYLREISKKAELPLKTTQNLLAVLEKEKVLKGEVRGKNKYFSLNLDNIQTKFDLLDAEIDRTTMFIEKYKPFKTFIKSLKSDTCVVVFGSFARLEAGKDSDLDLLLIKGRGNASELPQHLLPYEIHLIEISEKTFIESLEKQENLMRQITDSHVVLNNHSSFIDLMWRYHEKGG
jgi:predicted nucleotidyltransferase